MRYVELFLLQVKWSIIFCFCCFWYRTKSLFIFYSQYFGSCLYPIYKYPAGIYKIYRYLKDFINSFKVFLWLVSFCFPAGWESTGCAAPGCRAHVWASNLHDPCFWPEKWDPVSPTARSKSLCCSGTTWMSDFTGGKKKCTWHLCRYCVPHE